jgi:putative thiamine transport system permease protein
MASPLRRRQLTLAQAPSPRLTRPGLVRVMPGLTIGVLTVPLVVGLAGTVLPAFGYLPALGGTKPSLDSFARLGEVPGLWRSVWLSLATGLGTTFAALGIVFLFFGGWSGTRTFRRLQHLVSPLLAVPHAAAAFGLAFLIAPSGLLMRAISPWPSGLTRPPDILILNDPAGLAMMAGLIAKEVPFLFLVALAALPQIDERRTRMLTASLGYGPTAGFLFAAWPRLYRQIRLAVYAVVAYASSVVDVAVVLGPTLPPTLPVRLLQWTNDPDLSARFLASAGAVLQLATTGAALLLWYGGEKLGGAILGRLRERGHRHFADRLLRPLGFVLLAIPALSIFLGIAALALWSVSGLWQFPDLWPSTLRVDGWAQTLPRLAGPLQTTLIAGLASTVIAIVLVIGCLENETRSGRSGGQKALLALYLPLIVPQISFIFGLQVLFVSFGLDGRIGALILVHLVFVLPYVFLSLADPWRSLDRRYDALGASLGRKRTAVLWQVRLPMLLRAILTAAAVGFAVSVGQYLPTVLIGAGRLSTIATEAVALSSGGNRRIIGIYALVQTVLPFLAFAIASLLPALLWRNRRALRV